MQPRPIGAEVQDPSAAQETIPKQFGKLLIENKVLPKTMSLTQEREPKETKKEDATEKPLALPNAKDPFQSGSSGFVMMDDVQKRGWDHLVPQYRKPKSTMPIDLNEHQLSRDPGHMETSFLAEVKNVDLRPELNQCEVVSSWAQQLANVRKPRTNKPKMSSIEKSETTTGNLLRSEVILENFGFMSLTHTPLRYNTTTDTLFVFVWSERERERKSKNERKRRENKKRTRKKAKTVLASFGVQAHSASSSKPKFPRLLL